MELKQIVEKLRTADLVSKVAMPKLGFDKVTLKELVAGSESGHVELAHYMGVVNSGEILSTTYGESVKFRGNFGAVRSDFTKAIRGAVCYLPRVAEDFLSNALEAADGAVTIAFTIGAVKNEASAVGYEFTVTPLLEAEAADPLLTLAGIVSAKLTARLPAPEPKAEEKKGKK